MPTWPACITQGECGAGSVVCENRRDLSSKWHAQRVQPVGPARASADIVLAFGHGHVGLCGSARTGRLVAQLLAGAAPDVALAPFDLQRF